MLIQGPESTYIVQEQLGQGLFGRVYRIQNQDNQLEFAMKIAGSRRFEMQNEIDIMQCLKDLQIRNVIDLKESFEVCNYKVVIMELASYSLREMDLLNSEPEFSLLSLVDQMEDLAESIQKMHMNGLTHNDIHSGNVLIGKDRIRSTLLLADFGASSRFEPSNFDLEHTCDDYKKYVKFDWKRFLTLFGNLLHDSPKEKEMVNGFESKETYSDVKILIKQVRGSLLDHT